jgi:hypothetical protein
MFAWSSTRKAVKARGGSQAPSRHPCPLSPALIAHQDDNASLQHQAPSFGKPAARTTCNCARSTGQVRPQIECAGHCVPPHPPAKGQRFRQPSTSVSDVWVCQCGPRDVMPEGLGEYKGKGCAIFLPVRTSFGFVVTYVWIHVIVVRIDGTAVCGIESHTSPPDQAAGPHPPPIGGPLTSGGGAPIF